MTRASGFLVHSAVAALAGIALLCDASGARAEDVASSGLSPTLVKVAKAREALQKLKQANDAKKATGSKPTASRFIKYGVSVGVGAAVYFPGFGGNTLDGVTAGAMPYVGFFPAYWQSDSAKASYCALEWSAPERDALAAGDAEAPKGPPANTEKKVDEAIKGAEEAVKDAEAKTKEADAADRAKALVKDLPSAAAETAVAAERDAGNKQKEAEAAAASAEEKVAGAQSAADEANRITVNDVEYAGKLVSDAESLRELKVKLLRSYLAKSVFEPAQMIALAEQKERSYPEDASKPWSQEVCVRLLTEDRLLNIAHTGSDEKPVRMFSETRAGDIAHTACTIAAIDADLVWMRSDRDDADDGYRRQMTNCLAHRFGAFVGYPAMFSATTIIDARTAQNRKKRDVTPVLSLGLVFAPNALVGTTFGPWFGMTEVTPDEDAFVWGLSGSVAVTADVFSLVR